MKSSVPEESTSTTDTALLRLLRERHRPVTLRGEGVVAVVVPAEDWEALLYRERVAAMLQERLASDEPSIPDEECKRSLEAEFGPLDA